MYQDPYDKGKRLITKDACMTFYEASKSLYMDTYTSGIGLVASLLQMWECMNCRHEAVPNNVSLKTNAFANKSLPVQSSSTTTSRWKH